MKTQGRGLKKEIWISICSKHSTYSENCTICKIGRWERLYKYKFSLIIYYLLPSLWRWWANRKYHK